MAITPCSSPAWTAGHPGVQDQIREGRLLLAGHAPQAMARRDAIALSSPPIGAAKAGPVEAGTYRGGRRRKTAPLADQPRLSCASSVRRAFRSTKSSVTSRMIAATPWISPAASVSGRIENCTEIVRPSLRIAGTDSRSPAP